MLRQNQGPVDMLGHLLRKLFLPVPVETVRYVDRREKYLHHNLRWENKSILGFRLFY